MNAEFMEQVQFLMHLQHYRNVQKVCLRNGNYQWLSNKRPSITWLSNKDEFLIRQALKKLNDKEKVKVVNQLLKWIEEHPDMQSAKVPEICLTLLNRAVNNDVVKNVTISRMASFRKSLRRFSLLVNKVTPAEVPLQSAPARSVTFNDTPTIYSIYNN